MSYASRKSLEILVPVVGLAFVGALLLYVSLEGLLIVGFFRGQPPALVASFVAFGFIFLLLAYTVWRRIKWAYPAAMILSALFIVQFLGQLAAAVSGFSNVQEFVEGMSAVSALVLVFIYSGVGARSAWRRSPRTASPRMIPVSSTLVLLAVGFVIGASLIGAIAGGDISSIVASSSGKADITIVIGASNQNNGQFFMPANYTIVVGQTVVWLNKDAATHTVTSISVPAGASKFDSGNIATGQEFSWTPAVAGTYQYYCSIHPWMKGTIVVTGG